IFAALPARPRQRTTRSDDRIARGIAQRPPAASSSDLVSGSDFSQRLQRLLRRPQTGTGAKNPVPILRLPFVDPHQAIADRPIEARRPRVGAAPVLAVPAVYVFVGDRVAASEALVPFAEVPGNAGRFARAMMLDPDRADLVTERQQDFEPAEVPRAEQPIGLPNQFAMGLYLRFGRLEQICPVRDDVEPHLLALVDPDPPEIPSCEDRRIHQNVERDRCEPDAAILARDRLERAGELPTIRNDQPRLDHNSAREEARWIKQHRVPREVEKFGTDDLAPLRTVGRREELEFGLDFRATCRHLDVEGVNLGRMAAPAQLVPAAPEGQPGKQLDRLLRGMIARQPLRVEQRDLARLRHWNG